MSVSTIACLWTPIAPCLNTMDVKRIELSSVAFSVSNGRSESGKRCEALARHVHYPCSGDVRPYNTHLQPAPAPGETPPSTKIWSYCGHGHRHRNSQQSPLFLVNVSASWLRSRATCCTQSRVEDAGLAPGCHKPSTVSKIRRNGSYSRGLKSFQVPFVHWQTLSQSEIIKTQAVDVCARSCRCKYKCNDECTYKYKCV